MNIKMEKMENIPPGANPYHYDLTSQGIDINERFLAMYVSYNENTITIIDKLTGARRKLIFPPAGRVAKRTRNQQASKEHKGFSSWVDIKA